LGRLVVWIHFGARFRASPPECLRSPGHMSDAPVSSAAAAAAGWSQSLAIDVKATQYAELSMLINVRFDRSPVAASARVKKKAVAGIAAAAMQVRCLLLAVGYAAEAADGETHDWPSKVISKYNAQFHLYKKREGIYGNLPLEYFDADMTFEMVDLFKERNRLDPEHVAGVRTYVQNKCLEIKATLTSWSLIFLDERFCYPSTKKLKTGRASWFGALHSFVAKIKPKARGRKAAVAAEDEDADDADVTTPRSVVTPRSAAASDDEGVDLNEDQATFPPRLMVAEYLAFVVLGEFGQRHYEAQGFKPPSVFVVAGAAAVKVDQSDGRAAQRKKKLVADAQDRAAGTGRGPNLANGAGDAAALLGVFAKSNSIQAAKLQLEAVKAEQSILMDLFKVQSSMEGLLSNEEKRDTVEKLRALSAKIGELGSALAEASAQAPAGVTASVTGAASATVTGAASATVTGAASASVTGAASAVVNFSGADPTVTGVGAPQSTDGAVEDVQPKPKRARTSKKS